MLACVACSKHVQGSVDAIEDDGIPKSPATKEIIKSVTNQLKEMAARFSSGAYRHCRPCSLPSTHHRDDGSYIDSMEVAGASSEVSPFNIHHFGAFLASPPQSFPVSPGESCEHGHHRKKRSSKASLRSGPGKSSGSNRDCCSGRVHSHAVMGYEAEDELEKEWIAQVEPGVLITFLALPDGGNDLKRIRFSRDIFNKWQAQQWWAENCEKVHELYNVSSCNRPFGSLPTPKRSEEFKKSPMRDSRMPFGEESSLTGYIHDYERNGDYGPDPSALRSYREQLADHHLQPSTSGIPRIGLLGDVGNGECMDEPANEGVLHASRKSSSCQVTSTSDMDADMHDDLKSSGEIVSISNTSDQDAEWVEEDEPGVYITLRSMPGGIRELKRVRFSREKFTEVQARLWWEENRVRIHEHYLQSEV